MEAGKSHFLCRTGKLYFVYLHWIQRRSYPPFKLEMYWTYCLAAASKYFNVRCRLLEKARIYEKIKLYEMIFLGIQWTRAGSVIVNGVSNGHVLGHVWVCFFYYIHWFVVAMDTCWVNDCQWSSNSLTYTAHCFWSSVPMSGHLHSALQCLPHRPQDFSRQTCVFNVCGGCGHSSDCGLELLFRCLSELRTLLALGHDD